MVIAVEDDNLPDAKMFYVVTTFEINLPFREFYYRSLTSNNDLQKWFERSN